MLRARGTGHGVAGGGPGLSAQASALCELATEPLWFGRPALRLRAARQTRRAAAYFRSSSPSRKKATTASAMSQVHKGVAACGPPLPAVRTDSSPSQSLKASRRVPGEVAGAGVDARGEAQLLERLAFGVHHQVGPGLGQRAARHRAAFG